MLVIPLNFYLQKYGFLEKQISEEPSPDLGLIVVIPCFNEPDVLPTLKALANCDAPKCDTEIILVINASDRNAPEIHEQNLQTYKEVTTWWCNSDYAGLSLHVLLIPDLPAKHAGVGLARKIGMDEAVSRFDKLGRDGIIVCFDADSLCDPNYLQELENHFLIHEKSPGCSVYFEHPVTGNQFEPVIYQGIIQYELHLRYYNLALTYCGLPYAFHTVGSSMAVRSSAYQKQGGMNKRKAGEDFYFLHKIIALGNFTEVNSTKVIPSPRISDRVPFGTGRAIGDYAHQAKSDLLTYAFKSFELIREFTGHVPDFRNTDLDGISWSPENVVGVSALKLFLEREQFHFALVDIRKNSASESSFIKRFFAWFDAFRVLKLVHFLRDEWCPNAPVVQEVKYLMNAMSLHYTSDENALELLEKLRILERSRG